MPVTQPMPIRRRRRTLAPGVEGRGISDPFAEQHVEDYFVYNINFLALLSGASANGNIQIQADSHFKWISAVYHADIANAAFTANTRPIPNVTIQITDSGSGRQLVSAPVPIGDVFGTGQLPYLLPIPRIFMARSSIAFAVANFDAVVDYNLRIELIGTKLFEL